MTTNGASLSRGEDFAKQAEVKPDGDLSDLWYFLRHNRKWWLTPIVILLLVFGVLVMLGGSAAAPFIYTLF
jgi:hypothetical protein